MAAAETGGEEPVGEDGVLRQEGAVEVATDGVLVDSTFGAVFAVVAAADADAAGSAGGGTSRVQRCPSLRARRECNEGQTTVLRRSGDGFATDARLGTEQEGYPLGNAGRGVVR